MDKATFDAATFEELVDYASEEDNEFVSYNTLKDFAIAMIEEDSIFLAIHILETIEEDYANYYRYDASMGTLETPTPIECKEDFEYLIDE